MTTEKRDLDVSDERGAAIGGERDGLIGEIETAVRYPAESDDVVKTVLIGGLLTIFGFLLVPLFVLAGYFVRVLDRTADGDEVPPTFDDLGELTVTGVKAAVIGLVYGFVPLLVGGVGVLVGIAGIGAGDGEGIVAGLGVLGVLVGGMVWFALALLVAYLLPAALANFARTRSVGAGFDVGTLKPIWTSRAYALAWGTALVVFLIGSVVAGVLNVVPVLGTIAGAFVGFYFAVAGYSVIGRSWNGFPVDGR
ncbi:hypothetical protein DQW50_05575 [Halorubrum sp. 48-1-W]|uniref:DUF4013 domain-containing protein n=1 Tax=Halorubrum sp. 48-1-W TaxID=2249761 RepID=UPI000DCE85BF|nr:DUF4013 domain-containing protein [Halorubrum sp. 48-1-W]RAW46237.1 hypothetical protein DQW50_05575 [Halorubrum sp. 48-1-W]